jgi:translation initiation factor IF-1
MGIEGGELWADFPYTHAWL